MEQKNFLKIEGLKIYGTSKKTAVISFNIEEFILMILVLF